MKIRSSIRKICEKRRLIRRQKRIIVICVPTRDINKDKDNLSKRLNKKICFNMKWIYPYISDLYL